MQARTEASTPSRRLRPLPVLSDMLRLWCCVALFVAFEPVFPGSGLDASWSLGMNEVVARGMVLGREVLFTYGPFTSLLTHLYHPGTDALMLGGGVVLALAYWVALGLALPGRARPFGALLLLVLLGMDLPMEVAFASYPLAAAFACARMLGEPRVGAQETAGDLVRVAVLMGPMGLLAAGKGTMALLCAPIVGLTAWAFLSAGSRRRAGVTLVAPLATLVAAWWAAGQPLTALPAFFLNLTEVVSGYSEAMSIPGPKLEIVGYLLTATALMVALVRAPAPDRGPRGLLVGATALFLFVMFKTGFVRHDRHGLIACGSLVMAAGLVAPQVVGRARWAVLVLALLTWAPVEWTQRLPDLDAPHALATQRLVGPFRGLYRRATEAGWPRTEYRAQLDALRTSSPVPALSGSVDVYSYGQAPVIAAGLDWRPRPIFQSYVAYTPALQRRNRDHLLGPDAPDHVLLRVESIDGRLPTSDDAPSWPELLWRYLPVTEAGDALVLRRKDPQPPPMSRRLLAAGEYRLGETVTLPEGDGTMVVDLELNPSLLGRLARVLFKVGAVHLALELRDGETREFRLVPAMAHEGVLLSPLVETLGDLKPLLGVGVVPAGRRVRSLRLDALRWWTRLAWSPRFGLKIFEIPAPASPAR